MIFANSPVVAEKPAEISRQCPDGTTDAPLERLKRYRDIDRLSFRVIALMEPFNGRVPFSTLRDIYNGKKVPRKYRVVFRQKRIPTFMTHEEKMKALANCQKRLRRVANELPYSTFIESAIESIRLAILQAEKEKENLDRYLKETGREHL